MCQRSRRQPRRHRLPLIALAFLPALAAAPERLAAQHSLGDAILATQPRIVKIYGAGGPGRLESYQSGFLISDSGHVLTMRSYVLEADVIQVVLDDGRRYEAEFLGHDPIAEIAVLKIDAADLAHFQLSEAIELPTGARVLAFSNLYGVAVGNEPASVLHGSVSAVTELSARRGAFDAPYRGLVYVLDAMTNNPGAAGGALTDAEGRLAGILGKELRNAGSNTWLNYAIPISEIRSAVDDILAGRTLPRSRLGDKRPASEPMTLDQIGIVLVPDVVAQTPPYIDSIVANSPAERAGLLPDDLILFVNDRIMSSRRLVVAELEYVHRDDPVELTIQRGSAILTATVDPLDYAP